MKKRRHGWKEGILIKDLRSTSGIIHTKGSLVRYKKYKEYDNDNTWTGNYTYYYTDLDNNNLITAGKLLIEV